MESTPYRYPLRESLIPLNGEVLKRFVYRCGARGKDVPTRMADSFDYLVEHLLSETFVHDLLQKATQVELLALAEAAHGDGTLNRGRFKAKYGVEIPELDLMRLAYSQIAAAAELSLIYLFMPKDTLPLDVQPIIKRLISRPPAFPIKAEAEPPAEVDMRKPSGASTNVTIEVERVDTARAALPDLMATLALARDGKLAITAKTEQPTAATLRQLAKLFTLPSVIPAGSPAEGDDGIREFGFAMMIRAAGLAAPSGSKLLLTDDGLGALGGPTPVLLKRLWDAWIDYDAFDELSRVGGLKGQRAARTTLNQPSSRKRHIARALASCPTDGWISIGDFLGHLRLNGHDFDVEAGLDSGLYVGYDYESGWLGYHDRDYWNTVQASYARTILLEYAATLGVIDFAVTDPENGWTGLTLDDFGDSDYFSRYDGITHLRIGRLGRFILGLDASYAGLPLLSGSRALLVLPSLDVVVADREGILPWERAALERFSKRASDDVYRLSKESLLDAAENGADLDWVEAFLGERSREVLPQTVTVLFADARRAAAAVVGVGSALLVRCADEHIAQQLASHAATRRFCVLAANAQVAIPAESIAEFRRGVKRLGFVLMGERSVVASGKPRSLPSTNRVPRPSPICYTATQGATRSSWRLSGGVT